LIKQDSIPIENLAKNSNIEMNNVLQKESNSNNTNTSKNKSQSKKEEKNHEIFFQNFIKEKDEISQIPLNNMNNNDQIVHEKKDEDSNLISNIGNSTLGITDNSNNVIMNNRKRNVLQRLNKNKSNENENSHIKTNSNLIIIIIIIIIIKRL